MAKEVGAIAEENMMFATTLLANFLLLSTMLGLWMACYTQLPNPCYSMILYIATMGLLCRRLRTIFLEVWTQIAAALLFGVFYGTGSLRERLISTEAGIHLAPPTLTNPALEFTSACLVYMVAATAFRVMVFALWRVQPTPPDQLSS